jgi:hypothetical protein
VQKAIDASFLESKIIKMRSSVGYKTCREKGLKVIGWGDRNALKI